MKLRLSAWLLVAVSLLPVAVRAQSAEARERVEAAFMLALGRGPTAAELKEGAARADAKVGDHLAAWQQRLQQDAALRRTVSAKAFRDAFGREASEQEAAAGQGTYVEQVKKHVQFLAGNPQEYAQVLSRVYKFVISRDVYPEEIEYWKKHDALSYVLLVGCVDNWGRRNQPGLMVTAGTPAISLNCVYISALRVSPAVAAEARAAAGLPAVGDAASGHHIVAAGAAKVASDGRIHFLVSGKE